MNHRDANLLVPPFKSHLPEPCKHLNLEKLDYNEEDMIKDSKLDTLAFREKYPRKILKCPDCGLEILSYSSYNHYIAGDW